jgi:hypothetical protein
MSRYYRYAEPTHWRKSGKHRPRWCLVCFAERLYTHLGLLKVEEDYWTQIANGTLTEMTVNECDHIEDGYVPTEDGLAYAQFTYCPKCGEKL